MLMISPCTGPTEKTSAHAMKLAKSDSSLPAHAQVASQVILVRSGTSWIIINNPMLLTWYMCKTAHSFLLEVFFLSNYMWLSNDQKIVKFVKLHYIFYISRSYTKLVKDFLNQLYCNWYLCVVTKKLHKKKNQSKSLSNINCILTELNNALLVI